MMNRCYGLLGLLISATWIQGCGSEPAPQRPGVGATDTLVRLWELSSSSLVREEREAQEELLLMEEFDQGLAGWHRVLDSNAPLVDDPSAMVSRVVKLDDEAQLELEGLRGGMYRILSVEPNSFYEFSGRLRTENLVPADGVLFHGATYFVGELNRDGSPAQVFEKGSASVITNFHNMPSAEGSNPWIERQLTLQTGPQTRALLITCVLGLSGDVAGGKVYYDKLKLRRLDQQSYLESLAHAEAAKRLPDPSMGWRAERVVRENYGAETRPALVALPGERMGFQLRLPSGNPHLQLALGPWRASQSLGLKAAPTFVIRVGEQELLRQELRAPDELVNTRWQEIDLDLARWAGEQTLIELSVEGAPGVFAAPILMDRGRARSGPNLILISIDTLRADHVGAYGAQAGNTPTLDALARSGTLVRDVTAQAPFTLPSQVSMFSGQVPSVHGVFGPGNSISSQRTPMLAETLAREGFITRAFTAGGFVNPIFGFDRGFDGYSNLDPMRHPASEHTSAMLERQPERFSREMFQENGIERIKGWLGEHAEERFFLFLHTYTVHDFDPAPGYLKDEEERIDPMPYMHHEFVQKNGITPAALADIEAFYDAALRYVDHELGQLLEQLERLGLAEDTIIAVTSDHGKELGERGLIIHGTTLYEELTRIPMILRIPGVAPGVVEAPAMLVDLAPTLLAALGIAPDPRMQGVDLLSEEVERARIIWSEVDQLARKFSIREAGGLKLIHGPEDELLTFPNEKAWELYSLANDPGELQDLAGASERDRARLAALLQDYRASLLELSRQLGLAGSGSLDEETQGMLEQLGYF